MISEQNSGRNPYLNTNLGFGEHAASTSTLHRLRKFEYKKSPLSNTRIGNGPANGPRTASNRSKVEYYLTTKNVQNKVETACSPTPLMVPSFSPLLPSQLQNSSENLRSGGRGLHFTSPTSWAHYSRNKQWTPTKSQLLQAQTLSACSSSPSLSSSGQMNIVTNTKHHSSVTSAS